MYHTLKAGTLLYHGTDCDDFEEAADQLEGPAWLSDSIEVARHFAQQSGWGGAPRIVSFRLEEDVELPCILSRHDMSVLEDEHELDLTGREAMRESVAASGLAGWFIPSNYPEGADILIVDTSTLSYVDSQPMADKPDRPHP